MGRPPSPVANKNPAQRRRHVEDLKIEVLANGVRADPRTIEKLSRDAALTTHEYPTTGGLACRVGDVYLNAPFDERYCEHSAVGLELRDDAAALVHGDTVFGIDEMFPVPSYVGTTDGAGNRIDDVAFSHLDRVRLSPITGCAYDCAYCDLPGRINLRPFAQLVEAGEVALADTSLPIRHMLISGGSPGPRQQAEFAETLLGLVRRFSPAAEIDVMMSGGSYTVDLVEQLVDSGVHGLSINMELFSRPASETHIRSKDRRARPYLDETISRAVELLGRDGRVRSLIIPGLEPVEETLAGVDHIARLGADPVLSPFRPASGTALVQHQCCSPVALRQVLDVARGIVDEHSVALGPQCLPCQHNTLSFPWDVDRGS